MLPVLTSPHLFYICISDLLQNVIKKKKYPLRVLINSINNSITSIFCERKKITVVSLN